MKINISRHTNRILLYFCACAYAQTWFLFFKIYTVYTQIYISIHIYIYRFVCMYIYIYRVFHDFGHSWLVNITAGGDFLGLCDKISSYKHVSEFGRLRSYGHFLIPVQALVWTDSYGTSWRLMYSTWWLIVCGSCDEQLAQFTSERQPVLRSAVAFSKSSFKHRSIQVKGNFTKLTLHLYFKCIMYYAGLLFCSVYCQ